MTGGNARHGRRDNGLFAATYAAVGDVDPRIGEHLLDLLGNRGVAAYLQPTSDQHPYLRETALPARPTDRLYVDRSEVDTAREFLEVLTKDAESLWPEQSRTLASSRSAGNEFEEAWASIVASFDKGTDQESAPWPTAEDVSESGNAPAVEIATTYPRWTAAEDNGSLLDGLDRFGHGLPADDEDDDYHPPAPPPLPRLASITIVAILGIIAGIAFMFDPDLLPIDPTLSTILGGTGIVAGSVVLIGRLRAGGDDDDPDHGAVV